MSSRALVAYETESGFDLHVSPNGGVDFYLKPQLERYLRGECDKFLRELEPRHPGDGAIPIDGLSPEHQVAVNPEPRATNVNLEDIGRQLDFLHVEGLYVVRNGGVETYEAVWLASDILQILNESVKLVVYPRGAFDPSGDSAIRPGTKFLTRVSGSDFGPLGMELPALRRFVERDHRGILQNLDGSSRGRAASADPELTWLIADYCVQIEPLTNSPAIPKHRGRGIFVSVEELGDGASNRTTPEEVARSLRVDQSLARLETDEDESVPNRSLNAELAICADLLHHFGDRVAPFSPLPYREYLTRYRERFGPSGTESGPLYRIAHHSSPASELGLVEYEYDDTIQTRGVQTVSGLALSRRRFDVTVTEQDSPTRRVFSRCDVGDIVSATLDDGQVAALSFVEHCPFVVRQSDVVPKQVRRAYSDGDWRRSVDREHKVPMKRFGVTSDHEWFDDEDVIGDGLLFDDPTDQLWPPTTDAGLFSTMTTMIEYPDGDRELPTEVLVVNPPSEDFWYLLRFGTFRSGLATRLREEFDALYRPVVDRLR